MPLTKPTTDHLLRENQALRRRLADAEDTLRAIQGGEVDALVVTRQNGEHVLLLGDSSKPYQLLVERMLQGAVTLDAAGLILYCNESLARMLGPAPAAALVTQRFADFVSPESQSALERLLDPAAGTVQTELTLRGPEGLAVPVHAAVTPLHEVAGGVCLLLTDLSDILHANWQLQAEVAERRHAEAELFAQKEQLRLAIEAAHMGTWNFDLRTGAVTESDQIGPMFGLPPGPAHADVPSWLANIHPDDRDRTHAAFAAAVAGGTRFEYEYRALWPNRTTFRWLRDRGQVLRQGPEDPGRAVGVAMDITPHKLAAESLRASEERLRLALEAACMGTWEVDLTTGRITHSDQIGAMFGHDAGAVHADVKSWFADVHPEDREAAYMKFAVSAITGAPLDVQYRTLGRGGAPCRWLRSTGQVYRPGGAAPDCARGVTMDVTAYRLAEEATRASEERLRFALQAAKMAWWEIDYGTETIQVSPDYGPMVGRPRGFQHGSTPEFMAIIHDEDRPRIEALWRDAEERRVDYSAEFRVCWPDGRTRWLHAAGQFVCPLGQAPRAYGTLMDIDQRKRAEEALRESEQLFRQFADNMKDIIWVANVDLTKFFYVSKAYERIWGKTCQSLLDDMHSYLDRVHPDDRNLMAAPTTEDVRRGAPDTEFRMVRPDGSEGRLRTRYFPILDEAGNVVRIAGTTEDITDRVRLEEQFRQAQKMEAVGRLAGGVAHDFNNLLTIINGYSELLLGRLPAHDALVGPARQIQRAGERAAGLTRQLLAFSRRQQLAPTRLNLNALVGDMEKMLRRLIGEDIELLFQPATDLWPVRADAGQIEQVLMNLAVNARDALPQGGTLTIATGNTRAAPPPLPPGDYVLLSVRDTGAGMDPHTLKQIFEPFFTTKGPDKGTGLGLAMVYGIVKQSGGHIDVASAVGEGTTFTIFLPRTDDAAPPPAPAPAQLPARRAMETILLVEDEDNVRLYTRLVLVEKGYTVIEARNGQEALDRCLARAAPIHLLLCDVVLPGIGGSRLAENLMALRPGLKTLFMSGYTGDALDRHGIDEAGVPYLQKPFTPDALAAKVREVLDTA